MLPQPYSSVSYQGLPDEKAQCYLYRIYLNAAFWLATSLWRATDWQVTTSSAHPWRLGLSHYPLLNNSFWPQKYLRKCNHNIDNIPKILYNFEPSFHNKYHKLINWLLKIDSLITICENWSNTALEASYKIIHSFNVIFKEFIWNL